MQVFKTLERFFFLSSLNVVLATGVCTVAFMKLPDGNGSIHWISLTHVMIGCWVIYILDRLLDVIKSDYPPHTERHQYHHKNQYNLQVLAIALSVIALFLLIYQTRNILIFGTIMAIFVVVYLSIVVPKYPNSKDFLMPLIYTMAVVGVPFVEQSSISLSSWIIGFMFLLMVYQNLLGFSYFENPARIKRRKAANFIVALNVFIFILLFTGAWVYPNQLAGVIMLISICNSFIISNSEKFRNTFRWLMDGLLFLPLILLVF